MHRLSFRLPFSFSIMISSSIARYPSHSSTSGCFLLSRSFVSGRENHLGLGNLTQPTSRNFISWKGDHLGYNPISVAKRSLCLKASSQPQNGFSGSSSFRGSKSFFRRVLASVETVYLNRNPTAKAVLDLVHSSGNDRICYDHLAFRTFGVNGHGIDSMAEIFLNFGYTRKDELSFPAKELKAYWFSPPAASSEEGNNQKVHWNVRRRKEICSSCQCTRVINMGETLLLEFERLASESEYAAWTLVNGYALNHVTISVHRLKSCLRSINSLSQFIEENGFKLNSEGGIRKVTTHSWSILMHIEVPPPTYRATPTWPTLHQL